MAFATLRRGRIERRVEVHGYRLERACLLALVAGLFRHLFGGFVISLFFRDLFRSFLLSLFRRHLFGGLVVGFFVQEVVVGPIGFAVGGFRVLVARKIRVVVASVLVAQEVIVGVVAALVACEVCVVGVRVLIACELCVVVI